MVRKLRINETVNLMNFSIYNKIAILGYKCSLAANDLHHIHLCAEGDKFQEIHIDAENYMGRVRELGDLCFELAKEANVSLINETYALKVLKDNNDLWEVEDVQSYYFTEAYETISRILSELCDEIVAVQKMPEISSDVSSELDTYLREFTKDVNYFIDKKLS